MAATPESAVDTLIALHDEATSPLRGSLEQFLRDRKPPTPSERSRFRYPQLTLTYDAAGPPPVLSRAYAKFQGPGVYETTITQPRAFRAYLLDQLTPSRSRLRRRNRGRRQPSGNPLPLRSGIG